MKTKKIIKESSYDEEQKLKDQFDDYIDSIYEPYHIFESTLNASYILKKCDPIAYRVYFVDWKSEQGIDECPKTDDMPSDDKNIIADETLNESFQVKDFKTLIAEAEQKYKLKLKKNSKK